MTDESLQNEKKIEESSKKQREGMSNMYFLLLGLGMEAVGSFKGTC